MMLDVSHIGSWVVYVYIKFYFYAEATSIKVLTMSLDSCTLVKNMSESCNKSSAKHFPAM